jgi:hypothetical protein
MQDIVPIIFSVVLILLTVVLTVVGVQLVMVLQEIRRTLNRVNTILDEAETKMAVVLNPLQQLSGLSSGFSSGLKIFESLVGWLQRDRK